MAVAAFLALVAAEGQQDMSVAGDRQPVDMIVGGRYVVTMDADKHVIEHGAVAVKDGVIVAVGPEAEIDAAYDAPERISDENRILMPGLINGHTHSAMVLFRGMADDLPLMTWLQKYIFPMEGRYVDPEFIRIGSTLACWEMIQGGTTSFVDMYFYPGVIAKVVEKCGLRAVITAPMIDYPSPGFKGWDDSFKAGVAFVKEWQGKDSRITPGLAPHAPYTVSKEHLAEVAKVAHELHAPVSIHIAEDKAELETVGDKYHETSIEELADVGLLNEQVIAAHVVWPSDSDMKKVAGTRFAAIHNPTSNMKTGAGFSPVPKLLKAGVTVGLATDGAASNNDLNMWDEIHLAALIHKGVAEDPTVMPAATALNLATRMGAKAAGLEGVTGALQVGLRADMIQVSTESLRMQPLYDVISQLVYVANQQDVVTTIVDGKVLMKDRKVLTIDEAKLRADVAAISAKIKADLKKTRTE
ncbi:amidohydrolase family protein [Kordiimonas sp. A6E486]|nr:amidohydrolase family protein [Kordiimonas marina]